MNNPNKQQKILRVAIVGEPNAGKSTLLNKILGRTVACVTHQAHSTRYPIIVQSYFRNMQLTIVDTPGIGRSKKLFPLYKQAKEAQKQVDGIILLLDGTKKNIANQILHYIIPEKPIVLLVNKVDKNKQYTLQLTEEARKLFPCNSIVKVQYISALMEDGIDLVLKDLYDLSFSGIWREEIAVTESTLAQEAVRSALFKCFYQELPYRLLPEIMISDNLCNINIRSGNNSTYCILLGKISKFKKICRFLLKKYIQKSLKIRVYIS